MSQRRLNRLLGMLLIATLVTSCSSVEGAMRLPETLRVDTARLPIDGSQHCIYTVHNLPPNTFVDMSVRDYRERLQHLSGMIPDDNAHVSHDIKGDLSFSYQPGNEEECALVEMMTLYHSEIENGIVAYGCDNEGVRRNFVRCTVER